MKIKRHDISELAPAGWRLYALVGKDLKGRDGIWLPVPVYWVLSAIRQVRLAWWVFWAPANAPRRREAFNHQRILTVMWIVAAGAADLGLSGGWRWMAILPAIGLGFEYLSVRRILRQKPPQV